MPRDRRQGAMARWLALAALLVVLPACQAHLDVVVTVNEDGSGIVETTTTLDADASAGLLELDASGLILGDLAQAGWVVSPPVEAVDGSTVVTASKEFGAPAQFKEVMAEITGDDGPFQDFRLVRTKSFARVDYEITGTIDTTGDLDVFSDPDLEEALGRPASAIGARYGATEDQVSFRLELVLPGEIQSEEAPGLMESDSGQLRSEWKANLADDDELAVSLSSATTQESALVLRGVAVVAGALALVLVLAQVLRILIPDRRRRTRRAARVTAGGPTGAAATEPTPPKTKAKSPTTEEQSRYRVVALDGMGVLYREGNDIEALLIPFARERGASVGDEEIAARARKLSLGRITTAEFWAAIGVDGEPGELDAAYLRLHQLTPGVIKFLRAQRKKGVRNACITNDAASWAARLKVRHDLDRLIDPWVVSGAVGVRKPDPSIFEALRRITGELPSAIQIIDDDLDLLDVARQLGFGTAWFNPKGAMEDARGHPLIRRFDVGEEEPADTESTA